VEIPQKNVEQSLSKNPFFRADLQVFGAKNTQFPKNFCGVPHFFRWLVERLSHASRGL
jgi:hypothetical protein